MFDYSDLINELSGEEFAEKPVDLMEWCYGRGYLNLKITLSEYQMELITISSQIYNESTLINLHGDAEGKKRALQNFSEIIYVLGKGSGKDLCSEIALTYVVYQLLCLKEPAEYFGKDTGDAIDIINVAINSDQANNVFFSGFKRLIEKNDWFNGKFKPKSRHFAFDKNVNVYSGHSEAEAYEGYKAKEDELSYKEHITLHRKAMYELSKEDLEKFKEMFFKTTLIDELMKEKLICLHCGTEQSDIICAYCKDRGR